MKKTNIIIGLLAIAIIIFLVARKDSVEPEQVADTKSPIELCYAYTKKTPSGLEDKAVLTIATEDGEAKGEFRYEPAEKDRKVGAFEGNVGSLDPKIMGRSAIVWWKAQAEGSTVQEELMINFGEGNASVAFGEMVDRGDGVYVYKNKDADLYWLQLQQTECK